jgi:hypothetical protein
MFALPKKKKQRSLAFELTGTLKNIYSSTNLLFDVKISGKYNNAFSNNKKIQF